VGHDSSGTRVPRWSAIADELVRGHVVVAWFDRVIVSLGDERFNGS
jgi:hypothetical protein